MAPLFSPRVTQNTPVICVKNRPLSLDPPSGPPLTVPYVAFKVRAFSREKASRRDCCVMVPFKLDSPVGTTRPHIRVDGASLLHHYACLPLH